MYVPHMLHVSRTGLQHLGIYIYAGWPPLVNQVGPSKRPIFSMCCLHRAGACAGVPDAGLLSAAVRRGHPDPPGNTRGAHVIRPRTMYYLCMLQSCLC
jgi:hypothetical protein